MSIISIYLIFSRYCCWSQPLWWSEGSLLLNSKGEYLAPPPSSQPYIPLFREHCWPLPAPMSPTCTLVSRWVDKNICFLSSCSKFFRPALSLQIRPAVWRRSTFSSMAKVTWMTPNYVTLLGIRLSTVRHLSFQNGLIALTKQTINEMFTRPSLRWDFLKFTNDKLY